jgi:hypothetical protein
MNLLVGVAEAKDIPKYIFKALLQLSTNHLYLQSEYSSTSGQHSRKLTKVLGHCSKLNLWVEVESFATTFSFGVSRSTALGLQSLHIPFLALLAHTFETGDISLAPPILQTLYRNTLSSSVSKSSLPPHHKAPANWSLAARGCGCAPC